MSRDAVWAQSRTGTNRSANSASIVALFSIRMFNLFIPNLRNGGTRSAAAPLKRHASRMDKYDKYLDAACFSVQLLQASFQNSPVNPTSAKTPCASSVLIGRQSWFKRSSYHN